MKGVRFREVFMRSERKHFPTFVATLLLYGGINNRIFLCLVFRGRGAWLCAVAIFLSAS